MEKVSDIFDVFGGSTSLARLLGVNTSTASEMKRRESIPVEYWPRIVMEAKRIGRDDVTLEAIAIIMAEAGSRRRNRQMEPAQ